MFPRAPVILDTTIIFRAINGSVINGTEARLTRILERGTVIAYAGEHIEAEMPRKLGEQAAISNLDLTDALQLWDRYVRCLRTVDTTSLPEPTDIGLASEDESDVPTAKLLRLIAPVPVLSTDDDLVRWEIAHRDWNATLIAAAATERLNRELEGGAYGVVLTGQAVAGATRVLRRQLAQPGLVGATALLATTFAVATALWWLTDPTSNARPIGRTLLAALHELLVDMSTRRSESDAAWNATRVGTAGTTIEHQVARVLAATSEPLTRSDIARELGHTDPGETSRAVRELGPVMADHSAFESDHHGRWMLGRLARAVPAASV